MLCISVCVCCAPSLFVVLVVMATVVEQEQQLYSTPLAFSLVLVIYYFLVFSSGSFLFLWG